ncbi:MAG: PAS domain S-box protein [Thermodesulfovibrio sp.]|nr:PAS domain S-box protein [Thermodesulfovibrio sp.]
MSLRKSDFINNPFVGYAYHRIVLNEEGKPVDYIFLDVNHAFEKLTNLKREEIINNTVKSVIPEIEKDSFNWIEFYGNIAINGGTAEFEQYSEKLHRWYKIYAYSDEPMYFTVLFIDITRQKEAEINLALEKGRLEKIIKATDAGVWEWNLETNEIKICFSCPEKLGYSPHELEPLNFDVFQKLVHPDDMPRVMEEIEKHINGLKEFFQCDFRMKHKQGHWIWFNGIGGIIERDKYGKPIMMAGVDIDITWRKNLEEEIIHSRKRLQSIIESLPFPVWLVNRQRKILYQNKRASEFLNTKIGEYCWNTLHKGVTLAEECRKVFFEGGEIPENAKCHYCRGDEALDKKTAINDHVEVYGRVWDSWWVYIDEDLYLHYAIDITDKIKLRDEIVKADRLRALGEIAAGIAHDFNNLLQALMGNIELALHSSENENIKNHLLNAIKVLLDAKTLSNKLITFSEGGFLIKQIMPLSPWIRDITAYYAYGIDINYSFDISENLYLVNIDPEQMGHVIAHLIQNSYEAKPEGLKINISACNVSLDRKNPYSLKEGKYVMIIFQDNGPGIPQEELDKVFDIFFTTKGVGRGLGLALCYSIVKKHDGAIDVESKLGEGTKVYIYLPAVES